MWILNKSIFLAVEQEQKQKTKKKRSLRIFWRRKKEEEKKQQENGPLAGKKMKKKRHDRARRRSRKTREEIGKGTQMTALRFQIGKGSMEEGVTSDNPGLPWGTGGEGRGEGNEAVSKLPAKVASSRMNPRRDGHTETRTTRAKRSR